ncbi:MAG: Fructose-bisphosphate aldolase, partial [Candidatus Falkowbacteria bacterium GW2011_GWA2_39_24]
QRHGLLSVLWIYPRGQAVSNEHDPHLIAGAVGVAACLGADFVKVTYPSKASKAELKNIIKAAGKTGVIFSGGSSQEPKDFLKTLRQQIDLGARGSATGRNIHQRSLPNAIRMAQAITAIAVYNYNCQAATDIYLGKTKFSK